MTLAPRPALLLAACAVLAGAAPAAASPPGTTVIADQPSGFGDPLSGAGAASFVPSGDVVSADGRYVAFVSRADGLFPGDDDRVRNVYRKDRATGAVVLVSAGGDGAPAKADAYDPRISDDGNRIVFTSKSVTLDPAVRGADASSVYVRDVAQGTTMLVSRANGAGGAALAAHDPAISGDGKTVAFVSSTALAHDTNTVDDVYARRIPAAETVLVSRGTGADAPSGTQPAGEPTVSRDGSRIAFATASRLDLDDVNNRGDVYRHTLGAGVPTTELISVRDAVRAAGDGNSFSPSISADGEAVAYGTSASNLDAQTADTDGGASDVLVYTGGQQVTVSTRMPVSTGGVSTSPHLAGPAGALRVAFETTHTSKDGRTTTQVALAQLAGGDPRLLSLTADGALGDADSHAPSLSDDGAVVVFTTVAGNLGAGLGGDHTDVAAHAVAGGAHQLVSAPATGPLPEDLDDAGAGQLTPDARFAVFAAGHDGLGVPGRGLHVFRRDLRTGRTVVVDRADGPAGAVSGEAWEPAQSADGRIVAFVTEAALDAADANGLADVYVRDLAAGTTRLVSRTPAGAAGNGDSEEPAVSDDGRHIAFATAAADLGDGDATPDYDVHVLDLATNTMTWASRGEGTGDGEAWQAAIDADGSVVAFVSRATNLDPADKDSAEDVFVRDLAAGTTRLASRRDNGTKGPERSEWPALSADGRRVAFMSEARLDDDADVYSDVYVHDREAGTTVLASRATGVAGANTDAPSYEPSISADGRAVAFERYPDSLAAASGEIVVRHLGEATTTPVGTGGASALSANGACVLFGSAAPEVTGSSPDHDRLVLRAVRSSCDVMTGVPAPSGPVGGPGPEPAAPALSGLQLSRTRFAVGRARTAKIARARSGTVVRFSLDRTATVTLTVQRRAHGRWVRAGVLRRSAVAGANRVRFSGRIGRRALRPGRHRIVARARDAAGRTSAPRRVRFRIARVR